MIKDLLGRKPLYTYKSYMYKSPCGKHQEADVACYDKWTFLSTYPCGCQEEENEWGGYAVPCTETQREVRD